MADYSALRDTINNNIVPNNGRQEITGAKLNSVLNSMVDVLGAGYTFLGVATPTTNPTTPEGKAYYLAGAAGTYSNFGNIVVASDEVALLVWDGTAWSKVVTEAASKSVVEELSEEVEGLDSVINGGEINYTEGKYINTQGELVDSPSYGVSDFIPINSDNPIVWTWGSTPANRTIYIVLFDANKTPYSSGYWSSVANQTSVIIGLQSLQTHAPNAAFARASFKLAESSVASVVQGSMTWRAGQGSEGLADRVATIEEEMANVPTLIADAVNSIPNPLDENISVNILSLEGLTSNHYINKDNGVLTPYTNWDATDFIAIKDNTIYEYLLPNSQGQYGRGNSCYWSCYDAEKVYVSGGSTNASTPITIPSGAKYLRVSFGNSQLVQKPMVVLQDDFVAGMAYVEPSDGTYRDAIIESQEGTENNKALYDSMTAIRIVMPSSIALIKDKAMDVMYDNILFGADANALGYCGAFGAPSYGMKDRVRLKHSAVGVVNGRIVLQPFGSLQPDTTTPPFSLEKVIPCNVIAADAGSGLSKKVMLIGDSITANGKYPRELKSLFANDAMSVQFLGTLGYGGVYNGGDGKVYNTNGQVVVDGFTFNADGQVVSNATGNVVTDNAGDPMTFYHEGHGGWTAKKFCTEQSYNGYVNGFWNPTTNKFDFAYYMDKFGFSGVDYVFINLGINDVAEYNTPTEDNYAEILSYYDEMISSIVAYNANVVIGIGLCILPANYDFSTASFLGERVKTTRIGLHEKLISAYEGVSNRVVVPLNFVVDTKRDFPSTEMAICDRDATLVPYCTDNVHPANQGYYKIADVMHTYIKYIATLS